MKGFAAFADKTGWRISEVVRLTWNQVDLSQKIVRLDVGETKNIAARIVYLCDEVKDIFKQLWDSRKKSHMRLPFVFPISAGTDRVNRFDQAWKKACMDSRIGVRIFHDFRRTAVRNMVRSGIPERVAMMISGHKTKSVFDRYNIVNDQDSKIAAQRQEAYLKSQKVTKTVTIHQFEVKKEVAFNV